MYFNERMRIRATCGKSEKRSEKHLLVKPGKLLVSYLVCFTFCNDVALESQANLEEFG